MPTQHRFRAYRQLELTKRSQREPVQQRREERPIGGAACRHPRGPSTVTLEDMTRKANIHNEIAGSVQFAVQAGVIHQMIVHRGDHVPDPVPRQLPAAVADFVGRADEVAALDSVLDAGVGSAVRTVEGTAGVGKTTLVTWWAHRVDDRFPDGTLFANLHGYDRDHPAASSSVLTSFLQALGMSEARVPIDVDAQGALYRSLLAGRRVLVVLDNAASAEQVRPLLPGTAGCAAVVTSRAALTGLAVTDGAQSISLQLFSYEEAEELVRSVLGDRLDREPDAVAHLVDLCTRLPLALRVAASRLASRRGRLTDTIEEFRLGRNRLDTLSDTGDDRSAVRTVFDWSYTRLPAEHAMLFRRLGLHPNPELGLDAAAAFGGLEPRRARHQVQALVDLNLVALVDHQRYRVHDLLHEYAAQRAESDETPDGRIAVMRQGLAWYAATALAADRLVFPAHPHLVVDIDTPLVGVPVVDRTEAWNWLNLESPTILAGMRRAVEHHLHDIVIALAGVMRYLAFRSRSLWPVRLEAESLGLLAARASGDIEAEMILLRRRADTNQMLGRWVESDGDLQVTAARARESGDRLLLGKALCGLGRNRKLQHLLEEARENYLQALPLVRGEVHLEAVVESNLSQISIGLGRCAEALEHAVRELDLRSGGVDAAGEGFALHDVAAAHQSLGEDRAALDYGERAIAVYRTTAATDGYLATALVTVALSYERQGSTTRAAQCLAEAAEVLEQLGDPAAEAVRDRANRYLAS